MAAKKINVLVIDDAVFMRKAVSDILNSDPGIQVIGSARNGLEGLQMIERLRPDVVTIDIDMPVMDGLTAIRHIMIETPVAVVVLSSLFGDGAISFEALRLGVVDFVPKPSGAISENIEKSKHQIIDRIKLAHCINLNNVKRVRLANWETEFSICDRYRFRTLDYILALGTTLSGPNTIIRLLSKLPPELPISIVAIQDISPKILSSFVKQFDKSVPWKVEAARGDRVLELGTCYISPIEHSMAVRLNENGDACLKTVQGNGKPLNLLFSTAAETFKQNTIGVLLTGIGDDGVEGFEKINSVSGVTLAQNTQCCVFPNLTGNAIQKGVVDIVLNENQLPRTIEALVHAF